MHKSFVPSIKRPAKAIIRARHIIIPIFIVLITLASVAQFNNIYSFNMYGGHRIISSSDKIKEDFGNLNDLVIMVPKGDYEKEKELTEYMLEKDIIDKAIGLSSIEIVEGVMLTDEVTATELANAASSMGLTQGFANTLFFLYILQNDPQSDVPLAEYRAPIIDLLMFACDNLAALGMEEQKQELEQLVYARNNFESDSYSRIRFNIASEIESDESLNLIKSLHEEIPEFYEEYYILGESVVCYDMAVAFPKDNMKVSLFTVLFVLAILLFTFKNLLLPILLILAIQGGIWINFAIPFIAGNPISFVAYLLICAIQMGATIDYAIVLTNRYRSLKRLTPDKLQAMASAQNAVFATIITSGTILTITGFAMGLLASGMVASMGMLLGMGALISMLVVLFVLPSLLLVFDKFTEKTELKNIFKRFRKF